MILVYLWTEKVKVLHRLYITGLSGKCISEPQNGGEEVD